MSDKDKKTDVSNSLDGRVGSSCPTCRNHYPEITHEEGRVSGGVAFIDRTYHCRQCGRSFKRSLLRDAPNELESV